MIIRKLKSFLLKVFSRDLIRVIIKNHDEIYTHELDDYNMTKDFKYQSPWIKGDFVPYIKNGVYRIPIACYNYRCHLADCMKCKQNNLIPTINQLLGCNEKI